MKINNFRGDLADISAKKEALPGDETGLRTCAAGLVLDWSSRAIKFLCSHVARLSTAMAH